MSNDNDNLMVLTGRIKPLKALPFALQQIIAMFITNLVPIMMIGGCVPLPSDQIITLSQNAMIVAGIATFIQATPIWKIGSCNELCGWERRG